MLERLERLERAFWILELGFQNPGFMLSLVAVA